MDDHRQVSADRYYAEGCRVVEQNDALWARATDPAVSPEDQRAARHAYETGSARARALFKRHDVLLDAIARDGES